MASNYFTISPTGGTGDGTIRVTPTGNNLTNVDRIATLSINGQSVPIRQWGVPSLEGTTTISAPATGATYQFTVHTHYDVQFRNKPDWITIDDGQGNYISSSTTISASVANGKTYNITVSPNATNSSRNTTNFGLHHYFRNTLQTSFVEISVSQPQGAEDYITIISTSALDWDDTNAKVISVYANVNWSASIDNTTDFELGGGQGVVTIRAKNTNSGTTLKTTTISITSNKSSFPYTATCVVTQYRRPRISVVGSSTVPNTGGTMYIEVNSDYYWWLSPTVSPDTNAYYNYISMSAKTADANMQPVPNNHTYSLDFDANDGVTTRNVGLYVGYLKLDNSTTGRSSQSASFSQENIVSDTFVVTPERIPETGYAASGGGVYTVEVITERTWGLNGTPAYCTVSPDSGTGNATVTITIPPSTRSGSSYHWVENITFVTQDSGIIVDVPVSVWQYDSYEEPKYINVSPSGRTISSGGSASLNNNFVVSANTDWSITYKPEWATFRTQPIGGSVVTGGTSGETTIYVSCSSNSGSERSDVVWFLPLGAGVATTSVTLTQRGESSPSVEPVHTITTNDSTTIPATGGSVVLNIVSVDSGGTADVWWFQPAKPDYISATPFYPTENQRHSGGSSNTIVLTWGENNSATTRVFDNLYMLGNWGAVKAPSFTQEGAVAPTDYLYFSPNAETVTSAATEIGVYTTLSASTNWRVTGQPYWFKLYNGRFIATAGTSGETLLRAVITENEGFSQRVGSVVVSGGDITATYTLSQPPRTDTTAIEGYLNTDLNSDTIEFARMPLDREEFTFLNRTDSACSVSFTNSGETWITVEDVNDDTVTTIPAGEVMTIFVGVGSSNDERISTIVFTAGNKTLGIKVIQH